MLQRYHTGRHYGLDQKVPLAESTRQQLLNCWSHALETHGAFAHCLAAHFGLHGQWEAEVQCMKPGLV
jgi:hypothetical protein